MSIDAPTTINGEAFDSRSAAALTETMIVLSESPQVAAFEPDRFHVFSGDSDYVVDTLAGTCECPDALHRNVECKHQRRVAFATGERAIPEWVNRTALDDDLGEHVSGAVRWADD